MSQIFSRLKSEINQVIVGKESVIQQLFYCLLNEGHLLLLDVPGTGKTMLAKSFAKATGLEFGRIQGTPDLTPGDILGVSVYNPQDQKFRFLKGPIFCNVFLFDEINRTSPKTQSALMEAMAEGKVTIDGTDHQLPQPFILIATANPIESSGTFDLPDSQLDRFMIRTSMGYPADELEKKLYHGKAGESFLADINSVLTLKELMAEKEHCQKVHIEEKLIDYIHEIVKLSRRTEKLASGISPRGAQLWIKAARAKAYLEGRDYLIPDDLKNTATAVLAHRLIPHYGYDVTPKVQEKLVDNFLDETAVPV